MLIGELAKRAGVNIQTIRFYERRGLLGTLPRTPSGYRVFGESHLARIRWIRRARYFRFGLREIRQMVQLFPQDDLHAEGLVLEPFDLRWARKVRGMCEEKLAEFDQQIRLLRALRRELAGTVRQLFPAPHRQGLQPVSRRENGTNSPRLALKLTARRP